MHDHHPLPLSETDDADHPDQVEPAELSRRGPGQTRQTSRLHRAGDVDAAGDPAQGGSVTTQRSGLTV